MTVIRNMLDKIEQEQTNKLRSINDVKGENMSQQVTLGAIKSANSPTSTTMDFGSLSMTSGTSTISNKIESGDASKKPMSLQEKEAKMKQQQEESRLKAQPSLIKKASESGPKDLTATLMARNMNMTSNYQTNQATPTMAPMSSSSNFGPISPGFGMSTSSSMPLSNNGLTPLSNRPA